MSDIVKKYQHYFAESTRLQEMVNEQAAYIEELEEALLALSEDYFDSPHSAEVSRGNIKAAEKAEAAGKKPKGYAAKIRAQHIKMRDSGGEYGIGDKALERHIYDEKPLRRSSTSQVPMKPKNWGGTDYKGGGRF